MGKGTLFKLIFELRLISKPLGLSLLSLAHEKCCQCSSQRGLGCGGRRGGPRSRAVTCEAQSASLLALLFLTPLRAQELLSKTPGQHLVWLCRICRCSSSEPSRRKGIEITTGEEKGSQSRSRETPVRARPDMFRLCWVTQQVSSFHLWFKRRRG